MTMHWDENWNLLQWKKKKKLKNSEQKSLNNTERKEGHGYQLSTITLALWETESIHYLKMNNSKETFCLEDAGVSITFEPNNDMLIFTFS